MLNPFLPLLRKDTHYFAHIEGLRALGAFRVMLTHMVLFGAYFYSQAQYLELLQDPVIKLITLPNVLLDSFFVISGLVIGYSLIRAYKDHGKINLYEFFVRRSARIFPLYLLTIIIALPTCYNNLDNVWANILFVNNFLPISEQYAGWTWALAVEIQFYLLFGLIMWLLSKKIIGKKMCQTLVIGFFLMPFIIIPFIIIHYQYYYLSRLSSVLTTKESWFYLDIGFDKLYIRSGPILYGLITAYFLVYHKDKLQDFIKRLSTTYVSAISVLLFATLYFVLVNDPIRFFEKSMDVWQTSTYWGLLIQHHLFALALCLLLLLANAPKGIIMVTAVKILSSVVLRPLGRLSYTTYMIHPVVFLLGYSVFFATHTSVSALDYVQQGLWLILITYLLAIPCHLLIEHPALKIKNWRDIFFSSLQGTSKEPTP